MLRLATGAAVAMLLAAAACSSAPPKAPADKRGTVTAVTLAAFEVRDNGIDRFEHCPPAGDVGTEWLPAIPEWHPPSANTSAAVPEGAVTGEGEPTPAGTSDDSPPMTPASLAQLTTDAVTATHTPFRSCYHHGLLYDPTQDGRVGVVLHVDRTGHVASVETWGACDLTPDALVCMRDAATRLHLPPPADGSATVTVPAVFTNGRERVHGPNDGYAASAYVAIESMRPRLHVCLDAARQSGQATVASALMTVDVDAQGHGVHIGVDQWKGGHELLACAAQVVRDAPYPKPPAGSGRVVVPVVFNPRPGTR